jgi:hypothetical protein
MPAQTKIQIRRGTTAEWLASIDALSQGELGYDLSLKKFKVGDGTSLWSSLPWATIIGSDLVGSSGINISYAAGSGIATVSVTGLTSSYLSDFSSAVSGLLPVKSIIAGNNITVSPTGDNGFVISSPVNENTVKDIIGSTITGVSGIAFSYDNVGKTATISLSDPSIQLNDITDLTSNARTFLSTPSSSNLKTLVTDETGGGALVFASGATLTNVTLSGSVTVGSDSLAETIDDRVANLVTASSGIGVSYNDAANTLQVSITGIPTSLITNFASGVNALIDNAVSASIVGGSGVDIVYSSGTNTLTISSALTAGSGIALTHNSGNYVVSLSDPTVQLVDVTDLSANARSFLLTPSSNNLSALVTDETGSGNLVFSNSPTLVSPNIGVATGTSFNSITGLSSSTPLMDSTAAVGTATTAARADHVHPTDTSRAAVAGNLAQFASTTSSQLAGVISDETGSGLLVFNNSPTLVNPTLGAATATSVNKVTITAPANGSTLTVADGKTLTANNTLTFSGTDSSSVSFGAGGTVLYTSNKLNALSSTTSSELAGVISDETGTGSLVFANNPTMSGVTVNGNLTVSGSGLVASNINDFNTAVRTNRLDQMSAPSADVSFNSVKITSLADPVSAQDAATKAYVDAARMGLDVKASVRVATTENITRSGTQTIDGVVLVAGDRVLVKNQSTGSQNGIYEVAAGSWNRASDADSSSEVTAGMFTFVSEGTANADSGWVLTTNDEIVLGTTSLVFAQFSGAGQITAGAGLTKNGNTIDAVGTAGRIVVNADSIDLDTVSQTDGSGSSGTSFVQSVTRDSYGRVTGVTTSSVQDASTSAKGIASFDSGDFSVSSGSVSIKTSGVDNSQLVNSSVTIGSTSVSLGGTITAVSGLSSVSSTSFVGNLTGTATNANNVEVDLSTSNVNNLVFVNGTDGNLKPSVNNNLRFDAANNQLLGSSNTTPATTLKYFIIDGGTP